MKRNLLFFLTFAFFLPLVSKANNLKVTNVSQPANDEIKFDISWENSWDVTNVTNGSKNWDAAWVFLKYQDCETDEKLWKHVTLSTTSADHTAGGLIKVDAVTDGMGVFIRRSAPGQGNIPATSITLKLGQSYTPASTNFEIMAVEMVFVPEGKFFVGGTSGSTGGTGVYKGYSLQSSYEITSEALIPAGELNTDGVTVVTYDGYVPEVPAEFPKGFNSFYCMKYEISQEQWVRFLNLLTPQQQATRTAYSPSLAPKTRAYTTSDTYRNGVQVQVPQASATVPAIYMNNLSNNDYFNNTDDGQSIAMNFLNWADLLAYMDWSGLRPMTELEYEKAARGTQSIIIDEYAWGNTLIEQANNTNRLNANYNNEGTSQIPPFPSGVAAYGYGNTYPYRVGFAATATSTRFQAGASYWGILELTGNVWEQTFSVGYKNDNIALFTGVLGDGELDAIGNADQSGWDLDPVKSIVKGGSYATGTIQCRVSDRSYINSVTYNNPAATRSMETGGRGVRQFNP